MDAAIANQIENTIKNVILDAAPEEVQEFILAISEDGVTQAEVDEFRAMTIEAIDNPRAYPKYMRYLESTELMDKADIPDIYDVGFMITMLGMAGIAQDLVND